MTDAPPSTEQPPDDLARYVVDPRSVQCLGYGFCRRKQVVVLGVLQKAADAPATVGMADPDDRKLVETLSSFLRRPIEPVRLTAQQVHQALDIGYGRARVAGGTEPLMVRMEADATTSVEPTKTARVLVQALEAGATHLHIEERDQNWWARIRVDGVLHPFSADFTPDLWRETAAELVEAAGLDREAALPRTGTLTVWLNEGGTQRAARMEVTALPHADGEDLVVRLGARPLALAALPELGLAGEELALVRAMLWSPEGLVAVAGPEGSGRTTTLYAMLDRLGGTSKKVLTLEPRIEHRFASVVQTVAPPGADPHPLLESMLRHDADVLMLDEIGEERTLDLALQAAHRGRLVLAGFMCPDTSAAIELLRNRRAVGSAAEVLLGVVCQRLLRRLCPTCREPASPDAFAQAVFDRIGRRFDLYRSTGCDACHGRGFRNRVGVFEVLAVDQSLANAIAEGAPGGVVRERALAGGMRSLLENSLALVEDGVTSMDEVRRCLPMRALAEPGRR